MSSHNSKIVVVGSLNADFVLRVARFPVPGETITGQRFDLFPGGKGANQAYAAARLGANVSLIGQVGNDSQGAWLKQNLESAGVDVSQVGVDRSVSSGVATITINSDGQNQIIIVPGANGTFGLDQLRSSESVLKTARLVLLQLEIPIETVVAAAQMAKQAGATVVLDPAPAQDLPDELLACADYLTPNETELAALTHSSHQTLPRAEAGRLARMLQARGARKVLLKMGAAGALLVGSTSEHYWPVIPVTVLDTTAAGDAFNAAFAYGLSEGQSEQEAGAFANAAGACSVMRAGAQPSMPDLLDVRRMMKLNAGE